MSELPHLFAILTASIAVASLYFEPSVAKSNFRVLLWDIIVHSY